MTSLAGHLRPFLIALCLGVLAARPLAASSQEPLPAGPVTLEQVLELAVARSEAVTVARSGLTRAEAEQARARSALYPQLLASVIYDRALASEFEGVFDDLPGFGGQEEVDLPFGRANTWRVNLSFTQNLFSGGRIGAQQALASAGRTAAEIGVTTTRAQVLLEVTQAYYDAALSERLVAIAEATLAQADATVRLVSASFNAGTQPEFELLRARVTRDTQIPALIRQRANRELALIRLKQLLDLPVDYDLQLAVSLDDAAAPAPFAARVADVEQRALGPNPVAALVASPLPLPDRAPIQEAATAVRLREAALDAARAERMPSVSLHSLYGRVGYPSGVVPMLDRTNWTVGFSLSVPVLTGGRQRASEAMARAELEQSRAQLQQIRERAAVDTRAAWADLVAAHATWQATAGTVEQAVRAHDIAQVRYREGVSTQLELSDARLLLQQAEANRTQAARDLQVARARAALLPDLPLGTPGTSPPVMPVVPQPSLPAPGIPAGANPLRNAGTGGPGVPAASALAGGQL